MSKQQKLFKTKIVPGKAGSGNLFEEEFVKDDVPVECLGMTFENDEKRREYFLEKLREKLKDPEFRKIEGFPIGEDEDILALSDPPYYTACPNPFIEDFIKEYGKQYDPETDEYRLEPFAADAKGSRHNPVYKAHTYHTKVPWEALVPYLQHYLPEGGVVLDCFSGSGMTGISAKKVGTTSNPIHAILKDLSPAATFIANNTLHPSVTAAEFTHASNRILVEAKRAIGDLWKFKDAEESSSASDVAYFIWSESLICPNCGEETTLWDAGYQDNPKTDRLQCPSCGFDDKRTRFERKIETYFDDYLAEPRKRIKRVPVAVSLKIGRSRTKRILDGKERACAMPKCKVVAPHPVTGKLILNREGEWGVLHRRGYHYGVQYVHDFFTIRSWETISWLWNCIQEEPYRLRSILLFWMTSCLNKSSLLMAYNPDGIGRVMKGTLYIGSVTQEMNPLHILGISQGDICRFLDTSYASSGDTSLSAIDTSSSTEIRLPGNSVDYTLIDPPFGGVVPFVELNHLWEGFLRLYSKDNDELTVNAVRGISEEDYATTIQRCFKEIFRTLKPGRWLTVIFHNSKNSIWNLIQQAIGNAGFVVADVRVLDRKQGAIKQVTSAGAVKQDLVISAYKPNGGLEHRFKLTAGTEDGVWDFVRTHLKQLPSFVSKDGQAEVIAERQNYLLFDRMVAFHVQRGVTVPLSAAEFYAGLEQRFPQRDNMYFLPDQAAEYDKKRMTVREVLQLQLFVTDESSAIQWLKQKIIKKPQSFQELHPKFTRELHQVKHEKMPDLRDELLEQNFLRYDGKGEVPSQIHSYLSTNFKELRNLPKDNERLRSKAKDRWYVPDPNKAGDLEKLREKTLLKEFQGYTERTKKFKRNEKFRLEAVRVGFKKAWQERDYATIIAVANKIPEKILQEDSKLLMWYDQALTRTGE